MSGEKPFRQEIPHDYSDSPKLDFRQKVFDFCRLAYGDDFILPLFPSPENQELFDRLLEKLLGEGGVIGVPYDTDVPNNSPPDLGMAQRLWRLADLKSFMPWEKISDKKENHNKSIENHMKLAILAAKDCATMQVFIAMVAVALQETPNEQIAKQVLSIWAPIADVYGFTELSRYMGELAFEHSNTDDYLRIRSRYSEQYPDGEEIESFCQNYAAYMESMLQGEVVGGLGVTVAVSFRRKGYYSLYQKEHTYHDQTELEPDFIGFRVIVDRLGAEDASDADLCYMIASAVSNMHGGVIYSQNYIQTQKVDGYSSYHVVVAFKVGPMAEGSQAEIQVRTRDMHEVIENDPSVRRAYEGRRFQVGRHRRADFAGKTDKITDWRWKVAGQIRAGKKEFKKIDLLGDRLLIYNHKGYIFEVDGSSSGEGYDGDNVLDLVFRIHSQWALFTESVYINGKIAPFTQVLRHGDVIEINYDSTRDEDNKWVDGRLRCSTAWLEKANSPSTKERIIKAMRKQEHAELVARGKVKIAERIQELRAKLKEVRDLDEITDDEKNATCKKRGTQDFDIVLRNIGAGTLIADCVVVRLMEKGSERIKIDDVKEFYILVDGNFYKNFRVAGCCAGLAKGHPALATARNGDFRLHKPECQSISTLPDDNKHGVVW